ncbi:hypothetical protein MGSAQ_001131 [marine sediment metagenome]|uniref:Uncharacterized protein n=1 Tax=marine sediment metagenome TaxID=412755 RepID=A0A1B6NWM8_9ZZZZ
MCIVTPSLFSFLHFPVKVDYCFHNVVACRLKRSYDLCFSHSF